MKSMVELYWSMNACTLAWTAEVSGPGAPIDTLTSAAVVAFSVSVTPASASVTVFEVLVLATPSTVYSASSAACALREAEVRRGGCRVTEIVFAAPVVLPDSTSLELTTEA